MQEVAAQRQAFRKHDVIRDDEAALAQEREIDSRGVAAAQRQFDARHAELAATHRSLAERLQISEVRNLAPMDDFTSVKIDVKKMIDDVVAEPSAGEAELLERIRVLQSTGSTSSPQTKIQEKLEIAQQEIENWIFEAETWQQMAEEAEARLCQSPRPERHNIGTPS